MRIIAFGDVHMDLGKFKSIPKISEADLVIITGDITNFGAASDAEKIISQINAINNNVVALAGNLDRKEVDLFLSQREINLHGRGVILEKIGFFGVGASNPTPFNTPNEISENDIQMLLETAFENVKSAPHHILISHTPPFQTAADRIGNGLHVGSQAVRTFIEKIQPKLCLCGHIHEARAQDSVGRTKILNPGMIKDGGYIEVVLDGNTLQASIKDCT